MPWHRGLKAVLLALTAWVISRGEFAYALSSPPPFPKGEIGTHLHNYLNAIAQPDLAEVEVLAAKDLSAEFEGPRSAAGLLPYFENQRRVTGGVAPIGFRFSPGSRTKGTLVFRDTIYGGLRAVSFTFDEATGRKIKQFAPAPAPAWALPATSRRSPEEMAEFARGLIERGCRADVFSGAFLVARDGETLVARACGEADKRNHVLNSIDTRFNLGSMNKMFTAVAVVQLMEQGRIHGPDPLSAYVDESWAPKYISDHITIDQLLSMTSGLGSYFDDGPIARFQMNRTLEAYKPVIHAQPLVTEPGRKFMYSDTGYFLLGLVVQKASGEDYFDYIRGHIYAPAGMTATDSYELDQPVANLALGYAFVGGAHPWRENRSFVTLKGAPDGGGYSTVGDLLRFAEALKAGKLVSPSSLRRLWTDRIKNEWGEGFYVFTGPAGRIAGKDGFGLGVSSEMDVYVDQGYVVIALSNYASGALAPMDAMRAELALVAGGNGLKR